MSIIVRSALAGAIYAVTTAAVAYAGDTFINRKLRNEVKERTEALQKALNEEAQSKE